MLWFCYSVFLVDHAWTFQADCAQKQLEMISGLAVRMGALMGLSSGEEEGEGSENSYNADSESGMYVHYIIREMGGGHICMRYFDENCG